MIEINNFFNIFQQYGSIIDSAELLHEGIATARKLLNNVDTNWKQQEPRVTDLKHFILEIKWNRYIVIKNNVKFHILFLPSMLNRTKLYVSLCGGGRKGKEYPLFCVGNIEIFLMGTIFALMIQCMNLIQTTDQYHGIMEIKIYSIYMKW